MAKIPLTVKLFAPEDYTLSTQAQKDEVCNGCGIGKMAIIVPNGIFGVSIRKCCDIHDWMYFFAEPNIFEKDQADRVFLNNMLRVIQETGGFLQTARSWLAFFYYTAVRIFGGPAFWEGKNPATEEFETTV